MTRARILVGDCRARMAELPDASIDAVVTDPPYELGFMGKKWDASGIAYDVEVWRQALRVLKPGGHLLAFSGSRTYHRMTCAIEDAGFEVRDQIMWLYGSGFPKSLDVSKALDAIDRTEESRRRALTFTTWMRSTGITAKQINEATGTNMGGHYLTDAQQPAVAVAELFDLLRPLLPVVPDEIEQLVRDRTVESENMKRREVVGTQRLPDTSIVRAGFVGMTAPDGVTPTRDVSITTAHTDDARRWSGWGTALKPAHEPICLARKPFDGTVAANVLAHGTGAINVDACRVPWMSEDDAASAASAATGFATSRANGTVKQSHSIGKESRDGINRYHPDQLTGRWPANVIHDGSEEVTEGLREAARFFYTAKADRSDRDEVLGDIPRRVPPAVECQGDFDKKGLNSPRAGAGRTAASVVNHHPTVKPTELMRYLVRMVTPPGGLVLDPFTGSGSTGRAAMLEGMRFVGTELSPEYAELAAARIRYTLGPLFAHLVVVE